MNETKVMSRAAEAAFDGSACRRGVVSPAARRVKRGLDLVASVIGMLVFSPVFLIIYIAVKCEDGGKAIFRQERVGYHGEIFTLYKFRSMVTTSESDGRPALCSGKGDKRLTRVGRFLREHHLDELPQLWNVLKGEMSFVGPRPERKYFYEQFEKYIVGFSNRLVVTPGLTGYAQVNGGYELAPEEKIVYDMEYIARRSIRLDLQCIVKTALLIFTHDGAR